MDLLLGMGIGVLSFDVGTIVGALLLCRLRGPLSGSPGSDDNNSRQ